jgi:hypothetical protein
MLTCGVLAWADDISNALDVRDHDRVAMGAEALNVGTAGTAAGCRPEEKPG